MYDNTVWGLLDTLIPTGIHSLSYCESSHVLLTPFIGVRGNLVGSLTLQCNEVYIVYVPDSHGQL